MPSSVTALADDARWFVDEVQPHDLQLKSYLRSAFPSVRDVDEVIQESYLRVWKAQAVEPIQSARAFLFRVARNVALDWIRRRRPLILDPLGESAALDVVDGRPGPAEVVATQEKIQLLAEALDTLPSRCREIVIFCKLQGQSYREAAIHFGVSEKTVAEHVYRGVQRLGVELNRRGLNSWM